MPPLCRQSFFFITSQRHENTRKPKKLLLIKSHRLKKRQTFFLHTNIGLTLKRNITATSGALSTFSYNAKRRKRRVPTAQLWKLVLPEHFQECLPTWLVAPMKAGQSHHWQIMTCSLPKNKKYFYFFIYLLLLFLTYCTSK